MRHIFPYVSVPVKNFEPGAWNKVIRILADAAIPPSTFNPLIGLHRLLKGPNTGYNTEKNTG